MANFSEMVAEMRKDDEETQQWMPMPGTPTGDEKPLTNKMVEIVQRLQNNLLLVEPVLKWIIQKEGELAAAQLSVLYTEAELEEMRSKLADEEV